MKNKARILSIRLMTIITFVLFMSRGVIQPVNSLYVEFLGATYVAIGLLGTITSLTSILFSYVWGRASDYVGQRKLFLAPSLATMALSYGLMAIVPSYGYLFPLRILGAVAQAAFSTASLALMGDLLEEGGSKRGRRMGVYRGLGSLGFGLVAFLSGSIADRYTIRTPYYFSSAFLVIAFALALLIREPEASEEQARTTPARAREGGALRDILTSTWASMKATFTPPPEPEEKAARRLPLPPLLISAFLWSLTTGAVYAVWANYMVSELGYSQAAMSRLWALASTTEFPLMILSGWLSDRIGRLPMLSLGFVAWTVVFSGYVFVPVMPWMVLIQLTRGFAYSAFTATAMTYATEVRPKAQRGQVSGLYSSASGVGLILGSSLGGTLTQLTSFRTMIGTNAVLIFGGAIYLAVVALQHVKRVRQQGV
jgi:SET family sugar efflux transporter-like MFS transporter